MFIRVAPREQDDKQALSTIRLAGGPDNQLVDTWKSRRGQCGCGGGGEGGHRFQQIWYQRACGQLNRENGIFHAP